MKIISIVPQPPNKILPSHQDMLAFMPSDYWIAIAAGATLAIGGGIIGGSWKMFQKLGHFISAIDRNTEAMDHIREKLERLEDRIDEQETATPALEKYVNERFRNFELRFEALLLELGKKNSAISDDVADIMGYLATDQRSYPFRKSRRSPLVVPQSRPLDYNPEDFA